MYPGNTWGVFKLQLGWGFKIKSMETITSLIIWCMYYILYFIYIHPLQWQCMKLPLLRLIFSTVTFQDTSRSAGISFYNINLWIVWDLLKTNQTKEINPYLTTRRVETQRSFSCRYLITRWLLCGGGSLRFLLRFLEKWGNVGGSLTCQVKWPCCVIRVKKWRRRREGWKTLWRVFSAAWWARSLTWRVPLEDMWVEY